MILYLTLYIIYKIKVMFSQNWYHRETSLLFTSRQMLCSLYVRKCIRFCIPELQSWPEVKNTIMKFMKTQDKNTQISVYCIQHYYFFIISILHLWTIYLWVPGNLKGLQIFTMNNIIKSINTGTVVVRIQYHQQINHILSLIFNV